MWESLGHISFTMPWALAALLVLPLLWQLLKVTPPKPSKIRFPAVRLLQELSSNQILATKTPLWVLILRSLIALFLILAMAQPVSNLIEGHSDLDSPLVIVIDNDWSVMDRWPLRQKELEIILGQAEQNDQPVHVIASVGNVTTTSFTTIQAARSYIATLKPHPWAGDKTVILKKLDETLGTLTQTPRIIWLSNGLEDDSAFMSSLHEHGDLEIIHDGIEALPSVITDARRTEQGFDVRVLSANKKPTPEINLQVLDDQSTVIYQQKEKLSDAQNGQTLKVKIPNELKSRSAALHIGGYITPAARYLLDEKWRDRPVGIIQNRHPNTNLLDPAYYIRKSLKPHAPIQEAPLEDLLKRKTALLFDTSQTAIKAEKHIALKKWIEAGGIFVRFASQKLAETGIEQRDEFSPVQLMQGLRTLGGTLSWERKTNLNDFSENGPFSELDVPSDVVIKKQILARPDANLSEKTWARLQDGTPLITAQHTGKGWQVLFHVTAAPDWSNLPLSGTFELMMMRLLSLSAGSAILDADAKLYPYRIFDSTGSLVAPHGQAKALEIGKGKSIQPNGTTPPGLYGTENALRAFNLGPFINQVAPLGEIPLGASIRGFSENKQHNFAPWCLFIALILALIDWITTLTWLRFSKAITPCVLVLFFTHPALSEPDWDKALAAANHMRLAYMITGDKKMDETVQRGLDGLGTVLKRRTAVELSPAMAFNPEKDDPSLFPMIYWAITENQGELSDEAQNRLNLFLHTGGFLLMDTMGQDKPALLSKIAKNLQIGDLQPVSESHVLTRSFYLIKQFSGRFDFNDIWVEAAENSTRDRVSSVLIGKNAWAQAWARDDSLRPLYAVVPGGEIQREQAYRFGVNLVMYILSGNYKGDQVHLPAIMQRLGL